MRSPVAGSAEEVALTSAARAGSRPPVSFGALGASVDAWRAGLRRQLATHPGRTVALAAGTGYLLGGGLFSRLTGKILGTGLRVALRLVAVPLVAEVAGALAATALGDRLPAGPTGDGPETTGTASDAPRTA